MPDPNPTPVPKHSFWNALASILTQVAVWAAEHPQVVQAALDAARKPE